MRRRRGGPGWPVWLLRAGYAAAVIALGAVIAASRPWAAELPFRRSYALVIGIDRYDAGWPRLSKAVEDAHAIKVALERLGFEVDLRVDSATEELQSALLEFFVIKGADPDARLLLWFAGHGETIDGEGFVVPRDAPVSAKPDFLLKAIPMRVIGSFVRLAQARHVLSIFDSCFAGTIFEARGAAAGPVDDRLSEPVRQFLTSGDAGQRVRDDGSFREYFLRAITGDAEADFNRDGYVTGSELGLYMSQRITELTRSAQTPRYGKLHDLRFNRGDFAFAVGGAAAPAVARLDKDALFWQSIKWSSRASEYEAYLRAFPDGTFAGLARARLDDLAPKPERADGGGPLVVSGLDETMTVAGLSPVTVRARPGLNAADIGRLDPGSPVSVTGKVIGGPWYRLHLDSGRTGYLMASYLKAPSDVATPLSALPEKVLHVAFGDPINETVVIELDPAKSQIRRRFYLRNGAIAWFHGDDTRGELRFSIHVDSPRRSWAPAFRHIFESGGSQSALLENVSRAESKSWGVVEEEYKTLKAAVDLTVLR